MFVFMKQKYTSGEYKLSNSVPVTKKNKKQKNIDGYNTTIKF